MTASSTLTAAAVVTAPILKLWPENGEGSIRTLASADLFLDESLSHQRDPLPRGEQGTWVKATQGDVTEQRGYRAEIPSSAPEVNGDT